VRGPGEVAFGHHLVENPQQVQIEGAEVAFIYHYGECNASQK
jgi:hypothetical protein